MTEDDLLALIAAGETINVEFKGEERGPLNDRDLIEAVVCLANRIGAEPAQLILGVEDDGRVTGARPRHGTNTNIDKVAALISGRTRPALPVQISLGRLDGVQVIVIQVPSQQQPVSTTDGVFLRRTIAGDGRPACTPMDAFSIQSMQASRGSLDPSAQVIMDARWEDLDPLEFERFRRSIRERRGRGDESLLELNDLELAKALGVIEANGTVRGVRLAALLLFGKEEPLRRFVPTHEVAFQQLRRLEVEVNDFMRWPLLRVMEEIETRIRARNIEQELMVGILRVGVPNFSEKALREAVANALIHRDYQRIGAVHLQWHGNYIEITNPGGFPEGVRLDNFLVTAPRPRNPMLCDAFKRAGIVERTARGIDTIFFEQLRNGHPAPSYERSDMTGVTLRVPGNAPNLDFVRLLVSESQGGRELGLDDLLILNSIGTGGALTTLDAAHIVQKSESETSAVLHRLVGAGIVEERGQKRGRMWHLSAASYRVLGDKSGYVRQRGFEPLQLEQMVIQFVESHGRITRRDVAELCKIGGFQATRLLDRLVVGGRLERIGQRRGTWYSRGMVAAHDGGCRERFRVFIRAYSGQLGLIHW